MSSTELSKVTDEQGKGEKNNLLTFSLNHGIQVILHNYFSDFKPSNTIRNRNVWERNSNSLTDSFIPPCLADEKKKKTAVGYMQFIPSVSKKHRRL